MRSLVFCTTCRFSVEDATGPDGLTGRETLARAAEAVLDERGRAEARVDRRACLWSCKRHCDVWLRDAARFSYPVGDFAPSGAAAEAILAWYNLHGQSEHGMVPFRSWPVGMRGHCIARMPPEGKSGS